MFRNASGDIPETTLIPRAAPKHDNNRGSWKPAGLRPGYVNVTGGFNKKLLAAASLQYQVGDTTHIFVELDKNADWFLKGVGGPKIKKGDLKPVKVLTAIRDKFAIASEVEVDTAVADAVAVDPMDVLDEIASPAPTTKAKTRPKQPQGPPRSVVHDVTMPTRPECVGCDDAGTTTICVYRKAGSSRGRAGSQKSGLYLRSDFINWLLAYGADELHYQGVTRPSLDPQQKRRGTCAAVADLTLSWNFHDKAWEAEFIAGTYMGTTRRIRLSDVDRHWEELKDLHLSDGYLHSNPLVQRKTVGKAFITEWCAAIARAEGGNFETRWRLQHNADVDTAVADGTHVDSPTKMRIADDAVTALADDIDVVDDGDDVNL